MTKDEFYILNSINNGMKGRSVCFYDLKQTIALNKIDIFNNLKNDGYISNNNSLTNKGIDALRPYKVDNAVILAAGASTRFIPLSLEQPKGLFEVKGERLIERQIKQLKDAGIKDISIVIGYKKEMFYYLKDKYDVKLVVNDSFNIKNNIESLYLVKDELKNTYICVSDSYFIENPFNEYEYESFNAGININESKDEFYVELNEDNKILSMKLKQESGKILLGHVFWKEEFSKAFISLAKKDREIGKYKNEFWEHLVADNLDKLPDFYFKEYKEGNIFEFDYFEELRRFDDKYLGYSHSEIIRNIKLVFRCDEEDIVDFRNISKGLTNTSFLFKIDGADYIYRHPGSGTDKIINRKNEKNSLKIAKELGIDSTYIYEDSNEGWKISLYVNKFREPDYDSFNDSKKIIEVLRRLHKANIKVGYGLDPYKESCKIEKLLRKNNFDFTRYENLKSKIERLYFSTLDDGVKKCFCHGDTYKPNWMIKENGEVILIDWEYAGYSDPGIDVGYYICDAMYDYDKAKEFIKEYLQDEYNYKLLKHYLAYVAIISYYWFIWGLYREMCGFVIGESLNNWLYMANKYVLFGELNENEK